MFNIFILDLHQYESLLVIIWYSVTYLPFSLQVSAPAEKADAATVPYDTNNEPRFELKGMTFPSSLPLSSDSTYCDVYTSDKLNFKWKPWFIMLHGI